MLVGHPIEQQAQRSYTLGNALVPAPGNGMKQAANLGDLTLGHDDGCRRPFPQPLALDVIGNDEVEGCIKLVAGMYSAGTPLETLSKVRTVFFQWPHL